MVIPIPPIITKELFEKANRRNAQNKSVARRNYQGSKESLLRGGFAKCATCGQTLYVRHGYSSRSQDESSYYYYDCGHPQLKGGGKCPGCSIAVDFLDSCVAEYIMELIRDPSVVEEKIRQLQAQNPAQKQEQRKLKTSMQFCVNRRHFGTTLRQRCAKKRSANEPSRF